MTNKLSLNSFRVSVMQAEQSNKLILYIFLHILVMMLSACMPFHSYESQLPDDQLRTSLEAFRRFQSNYVDEISNKELQQGAINGMLKALELEEKALPAEIVESIGQLPSYDWYEEPFQVVADAYVIIESQFTEAINPQLLAIGAIRGMMEKVDQHASFYTSEEVKILCNKDLVGVSGMKILVSNNSVIILKRNEGTSAERAGVQPGDHILTIDGRSTKGMRVTDVITKLLGKVGSNVTLSIKREGRDTFDLNIIREKVARKNIETNKFENIGYLHIYDFYDNTFKHVREVLKEFKSQGIKALILDLRGNAGGLLDNVISVSRLFLDEGQLIGHIEGRIKQQNMRFISKGESIMPKLPTVVLVDKYSASGTEILIAALQDWQRATILGTTTFGNASIQTLYPLKDGSRLRLTTGRFITSKERSFQDKGITPDIVVEASQNEDENLIWRGDINRDIQLQKAIELLSKNEGMVQQ